MRNMTAMRWLLTAGALALSSLASAQVRISEIHYDNASTDTGEAIEVSAPAGTDLTGWSVVLYNGSGGVTYDTDALAGTVPAVCDDRGVVVLNYPANGIQNGSPDAIALVNAGGTVVEFLSYEGPLTATNGPANGQTAVDIGASQNGNGPIGESLQRNPAGVWALAANTFGACNDSGSQQPDPEVASITVTPDLATLNVGATLTLVAEALSDSGTPIPNATFTWSSGDTAVATVSATGVVTGVAPGSVAIRAIAANGTEGMALIAVENVTVPMGEFHINEIHYDNAGTDAGEAIEIEGPTGVSLAGFSLVLYNGSNGAVYNTTLINGTLPASCDHARSAGGQLRGRRHPERLPTPSRW